MRATAATPSDRRSSGSCAPTSRLPLGCDDAPLDKIETEMKDFSNASFPPDLIGIMQEALDAAVATLPEPVSSAHVQSIAETILRTAKDGERDPNALQRMALIELQISPRHG